MSSKFTELIKENATFKYAHKIHNCDGAVS